MKIYSCTGDDGTTSISGGKRLPKHHPRIEALGTVDELICWIGLLRVNEEGYNHRNFLINIQKQLMIFSSALAAENIKRPEDMFLGGDPVGILEKEIDSLQETLPGLKKCILPGGNPLISYIHISRCVCRRAERKLAKLAEKEIIPPLTAKYLNRLADYLFVLSRKISLDLHINEIMWSD